MDEVRRKVTVARTRLLMDQVFFGSLSLKLRVVEENDDPRIRTMATDGQHLFYNREGVEALSIPEVAGVVCHEVLHCGLLHFLRQGPRELGKWNHAADYAVNLIVRDAADKSGDVISLHERSLIDDQYVGMSAEEIYERLPDEPGDGEGGDGDGDGGDLGIGGVLPNEDAGGSPSKAEELEAEWKVALVQAAQQAAAMGGDVPESIKRMVDEIANPKLDWREVLQRFVDTSARNDYQWFPPNRRQVHRGMYLPAQRSHELHKLVVAVDTSGSITQDMLDQFAGEINSIVSDYGAETTVIYCDSRVRHVDEYQPYDTIGLEMHGGGGTDFEPPFGWLEERADIPTCMVYFTDGYCNSFPDEPAFPVLWVMTAHAESRGNYYPDPAWGEVIDY